MKRPHALPPSAQRKSTYPRNKRLSETEPTARICICIPESLSVYAGMIDPKISRGCRKALEFHRDHHEMINKMRTFLTVYDEWFKKLDGLEDIALTAELVKIREGIKIP